jgi:hypothetical protein
VSSRRRRVAFVFEVERETAAIGRRFESGVKSATNAAGLDVG